MCNLLVILFVVYLVLLLVSATFSFVCGLVFVCDLWLFGQLWVGFDNYYIWFFW